MAKTNRDVVAYGRLSFAHLFTPRRAEETADPKYSATLLIPKSDTATIQRVQAAIQAAVKDGVERGYFAKPIDPMATKYPPLRDGDTPNSNGEQRGPEFAGHWFIPAKASTSRKPFVVDQQVQPIIEEEEIYSGCFVNMAIQFFAYKGTSNKGISASLTGVQKVKDGERLGAAPVEATDVFSAIAGGQPAQPPAWAQAPQQTQAPQPPAQPAQPAQQPTNPSLGF